MRLPNLLRRLCWLALSIDRRFVPLDDFVGRYRGVVIGVCFAASGALLVGALACRLMRWLLGPWPDGKADRAINL